jgi:hypothetical protein
VLNRRLRILARVVGSLAALAMIIVGCTTVTRGTGQVDAAEAPVYKASVSASIEASKSSSAARESERQASQTTQAIHTACEALSTSGVDAIRAVNAYVDAYNENASGAGAQVAPAINALNRTAELVTASLSDALAPELRGALTSWVDAARELAGAIGSDYGTEEINAAIRQVNDSRANALTLCDAAYR